IRPATLLLAAVIVAVAVDLHDQISLIAQEIRDERPDGMLAAELQPRQPTTAEHPPKDAFGDRGIVPESSRVVRGLVRGWLVSSTRNAHGLARHERVRLSSSLSP